MMQKYFFPICSFLVCVSVSTTAFSGAGASILARVDGFLFPEGYDEDFMRKFAEYYPSTPSPELPEQLPTDSVEVPPSNPELSGTQLQPDTAVVAPEWLGSQLQAFFNPSCGTEAADGEIDSLLCNSDNNGELFNPIHDGLVFNPMSDNYSGNPIHNGNGRVSSGE